MTKFRKNYLYKILIGGIGIRHVGEEDIEFDPYPELVGQVILIDNVWNEQGLCAGTIVVGNNKGEYKGWFTKKQLEMVGSVKIDGND